MVIAHSSELHRSEIHTDAMGGAGVQAFYRRVPRTPAGDWGSGNPAFTVSRGPCGTGLTMLSDRSRFTDMLVFPLCFRFEVGRLTQKRSPSFSRLSRGSYATLRGAHFISGSVPTLPSSSTLLMVRAISVLLCVCSSAACRTRLAKQRGRCPYGTATPSMRSCLGASSCSLRPRARAPLQRTACRGPGALPRFSASSARPF